MTYNYGPQWEELLDEIDKFLEDQEDVRDGADGEQLPNKAMTLLTSLRYLRPVARPEAASPIVPPLSLVHSLKVLGDGMPPYDTLPVEVKDTCRYALDFICGTSEPQ